MLSEFPVDIRKDIRILGNIMEWTYKYAHMEDRENAIDLLKDHISDIIITMLLIEDRKKLDYFISNQ